MGSGQRGFTLLEMILVLMLASLILGMSSVFFAGFLPTARLNAAGREITASIRHARSLARATMESRTVFLDLDGRTYGIEGLSRKPLPPNTRIRVFDDLAGVIDRGTYAITFRRGATTRGGSIVLSAGRKTLHIEMDPITGAVRIAD